MRPTGGLRRAFAGAHLQTPISHAECWICAAELDQEACPRGASAWSPRQCAALPDIDALGWPNACTSTSLFAHSAITHS